jgi:3-oxoacyl-[acyl-carrier protein] reductase
MRLEGKVAIVTGSGRGLGQAIAKRFGEEGATVVVADIDEAAIDDTVAAIETRGGKALGQKADVSSRRALLDLAENVVASQGRIDVLVNNAGVTRYRAFGATTEDDWDKVVDVDLKGVFFCAQAVAPYMLRQQYGKIVNISSSLGTGATPHIGGLTPGAAAPYASAKAAVIQLTKVLARELGPSGVNVNCVAPGFFLTPLIATTRTPEEIEEHIRLRTSMTLLGRPGSFHELANAVLFLASDEASFITGETLCVDGGRTDRM